MSDIADSRSEATLEAASIGSSLPMQTKALETTEANFIPQPASSIEAADADLTKQAEERDNPEPLEESRPCKDSKAHVKPTTPPRVSFGVEIEFLVAAQKIIRQRPSNRNFDPENFNLDLGDNTVHEQFTPDPDPNLGLPPIFPGTDHEAIKRIADCLLDHGIPVNVPDHASQPSDFGKKRTQTGANASNCWTVGTDPTVVEHQVGGYGWQGVEISSPASYAYDEAFEMIEIVTNLIKANFRTRVNPSCGLHVHVGNGLQRLDFRATRNYAALLWSAEPLLSTLHYADRAVTNWSNSIRRTSKCELARGRGAEDAYAEALEDPRWPARYQCRARKLGEAPIASRAKFLERIQEGAKDEMGRFLEPDCPSDDEDWEAGTPFHRPKRVTGERRTLQEDMAHVQRRADGRIPNEDEMARLDACRILGGPPQIDFPLPEGLRKLDLNEPPPAFTHSYGPAGSYNQRPKSKTLDRTLAPLTQRLTKGPRPRTLESMATDKNLLQRLGNDPDYYSFGAVLDGFGTDQTIRDKRPKRQDTWSGVKEILSCDVGIHQVSYLMGSDCAKHISHNWEGHSKNRLCTVQGTGDSLWAPGKVYMTVENRYAAGSLDGKWIATWARINCRLLAFARDAEPAAFMRLIALLAEQDEKTKVEYDVIDLLEDIGCFEEAQHCLGRLERGAEAQFECLVVQASAEMHPWPSEEGDASEDLIDMDSFDMEDIEMGPSYRPNSWSDEEAALLDDVPAWM